MPYFICKLTEFLRAQTEPTGTRIFRKCRKSEVRGEFWCFWYDVRYRLMLGFPDPKRYKGWEDFEIILRESPCEEYIRKAEDAFPTLRGALRLQIVRQTAGENKLDDRVYLSLDRSTVYARVLPQVLTDSTYGRCDLYKGKNVVVSVGDTTENTPTHCRVQVVCDILKHVVKASGASVVEADEAGEPSRPERPLHLCVAHKQRSSVSGGQFIFVGKVVCLNAANVPVVSMDDCRRAFSKELSLMSEHRLSDELDSAINSQDALTQASLMFAFINGNISKPISLRLETSITPFCKGAVFVLYNYCRMVHIVHKYKTMERDGLYPPLPDVDSVDLTLLTKPEEWSMMYEYVVCWPSVFESTVSDLHAGDFKVHKILEFLKSLASSFSAYYRRTRVLTEPRPNLLPVLQARIYLILALMKVFKAALDVLGLQPVQNM